MLDICTSGKGGGDGEEWDWGGEQVQLARPAPSVKAVREPK